MKVIVEVVTDNKNRTAPEIKSIFEKSGGTLTSPGAVSYQFESTGLIRVVKKGNIEEAMLKLIDFGAEDVEEAEDAIEVFTRPGKLEEVAGKIQAAGFTIQTKELFMRPKNLIEIKDKEKGEKVVKFMETLEEHDDVQKVFANFDLVF
jgi:YebC/PmpR family DNA-binding regulatory protein